MAASVPFSRGPGRIPGTPLLGGRDHHLHDARAARRQVARQLGADARMGLVTPAPAAWLEEEGITVSAGNRHRARPPRPGRIVVLAAIVALVPVMAMPRIVGGVEPALTTRSASQDVVRVLADDAGHRLDSGYVREVEVGSDGTVWVAVGRRVLALGTPGAIEPRARGWEAFPRRLSLRSDGVLWAVEDGGDIVSLTGTGWVPYEAPPPDPGDPLALDAAAVDQLRAAGFEHLPRVLAGVVGAGEQRWLVVDVSARPDQRPSEHRLLRFDGSGWTVLGPDQGLPRDTRRAWTTRGPEAPVALAVDRAGRAWFSIDHGGLWVAGDEGIERVRFPGLGSGALDLAGTSDGAVWIASTRGGLFRWSPEGAAAL